MNELAQNNHVFQTMPSMDKISPVISNIDKEEEEDSTTLESASQSSATAGSSSPSSDNDDNLDLRTVVLNGPAESNADFTSNVVITSKYTHWNFVFKFLRERFGQVANFYFLLVGLGQAIPPISSTGGVPQQWLVLTIVLTVDAIFAAIEDKHRHDADAQMNAKLTMKLNPDASDTENVFLPVTWREVVVGDMLKIKAGEAVPADVLILSVYDIDNPDDPSGICFVETKSLDGETNLKVREALVCTNYALQDPAKLRHVPGRVVCERPNPNIADFVGRYEPEEGETHLLDIKNIALRGTTIRNSPYIVGVVLNTGADTKIMQSARGTPSKTSKSLDVINHGIKILMALLLCCVVFGSVYCFIWIYSFAETRDYLELEATSAGTPFRVDAVGFFVYFGYFWILIASFVPITLYVSIAIVKGYQTFFMNRDLGMYHAETDTPGLVRNGDLNDELGQITHIFSDKTGTLTANVMDFRKMSINGRSYGRGTTEIGRAAILRRGNCVSRRDLLADEASIPKHSTLLQSKIPHDNIPNVNFLDPEDELKHDRHRQGEIQAQKIEAFCQHLAVSHSVVLEKDPEDESKTTFSASSPDELALVSGAKFLGYEFVERLQGAIRIRHLRQKSKEQYGILELIEFTSTRKRMTVISKFPDGTIRVLVKGADNVIMERLDRDTNDPALISTTLEHLEKYASEGLRTLVIASRELSQETYDAWSKEYATALRDLEELYRYKKKLPNRIEDLENQIEMNLELLGATAIEDRLQDGVPNSIANILKAGVRIWVLTGDKEETAINIGYACQLLDNDMERLILNCDHFPTIASVEEMLNLQIQLRAEKLAKHELCNRTAIVVDGAALRMIFDDRHCRELFLQVAQYCSAVVCCRVSPKQKADVVGLVKTLLVGSRTLSIGDGANDVAMIQEAHVGVGISGHEGMQAVNSSDFAIAQFRFLERLLLVHGHWNLRRMAKLSLYVIYKNIMLYFTLFTLSLYAGGSGTLFYNNMWINGFNIFFTAVPIIVLGVLEQETSASLAMSCPALYRSGLAGEIFNTKILIQWIAEAFYESIVCAVIPVVAVGTTDSMGNAYSLESAGALSFCCMLTVCWAKLALNTVTWNWIMMITVMGSIVMWYVCAILISIGLPASMSDNAFPYVLTVAEFWIILALTVVICLSRDFVWKTLKREYWPELYHVLQELDTLGLDRDSAQQWEPPVFELPAFTASAKSIVVASQRRSSKSRGNVAAGKKHHGFAFSAQEDKRSEKGRNAIRSLIVSTGLSTKMLHKKSKQTLFREAYLDLLDRTEQEVFEIQRYHVLLKWGSKRPGHMLLSDPPRFTDATMRFGCENFDLTGWVIDRTYGDPDEHWEYSDTFNEMKKSRGNVVVKVSTLRKIGKVFGRSVRRRRWIRRDTLETPDAMAYTDGLTTPKESTNRTNPLPAEA